MLKILKFIAAASFFFFVSGCSPNAATHPAEPWNDGCRDFDESLSPVSRARLDKEIKRVANYSPSDFSYKEICKTAKNQLSLIIELRGKSKMHPLAVDPAFLIEKYGSLTLIRQE